MDKYQLQSRCVRGEMLEVKNVELPGATTDSEALAVARKLHGFIVCSPTWFAGTVYEIQHVRTVLVGEQPVLNPNYYD